MEGEILRIRGLAQESEEHCQLHDRHDEKSRR
jgi:hypothetical protein